MKIVCPHCNFTKDIDPAKLPPNAKRATCPKCRQKFDIYGPQAGAAAPPPPPKRPQAAAAQPKPAQMQPPRPATPAPPPLPQEATPSSRAEAGTWQSQPTGQGVPWETKAGGFFGDLFATFKMVLFKPGEFFQEMPTSGGLGRPLLFAIICGSIGIIFSIFYQASYFMLTAGMSDIFQPGMLPPEFEAFSSIPIVGALVGLMIASPILVILMMFIGAFFVNLFLLIVRGANGGYEATFRTMALRSGHPTAQYSASSGWSGQRYLGAGPYHHRLEQSPQHRSGQGHPGPDLGAGIIDSHPGSGSGHFDTDSLVLIIREDLNIVPRQVRKIR